MLKLIPMVLAFLYFLNSILSYFEIYTELISYIQFGLFIGFIYLSSYVFKFCSYHRMFIHYIVLETIINYIDYKYVIPLDLKNMIVVQTVIALVFLFIILHLKLNCNKND